MCLAIPSKIIKIDNQIATIDVDGVQKQASLLRSQAGASGLSPLTSSFSPTWVKP
jgi:hypothetical protein